MDSRLPPEIWAQIFQLSCTDTGLTGCSISATCRYFHDISKTSRLRSVAVQGVSKAFSFCQMIETLPSNERGLQNLYLSLLDPLLNEGTEVQAKELNAALSNLYDPELDVRASTFCPTKDEIGSYFEEQLLHLVIRILKAVAPTLRSLFLSFGEEQMPMFLPPVSLPVIQELIIYGNYNSGTFMLQRLVPLPSLHRMRLRMPGDNEFNEVSIIAPNLTHLRIDHPSMESLALPSNLKHHLQLDLPSTEYEALRGPDMKLPLPFPKSLERFILHDRTPLTQAFCGNGLYYKWRTQRAIDEVVKADPRIVYVKDSSRHCDKDGHLESLQEWMDRNEGKSAYWDEDALLMSKSKAPAS